MYYVMCRVSGGRTGTRQALLKHGGEIVAYPTREGAASAARRMQMKQSAVAVVAYATFEYWVVDDTGKAVQ